MYQIYLSYLKKKYTRITHSSIPTVPTDCSQEIHSSESSIHRLHNTVRSAFSKRHGSETIDQLGFDFHAYNIPSNSFAWHKMHLPR